MRLTDEDLLKLYRNLLLSRKADEAAIANSGKCNPTVHPGIGQEAVGVGGCTFLHQDDYICQTHRGFAHLVSKGMALTDLFAECFNKANSPTRGHGGTWHQSKPNLGIMGVSGTIGGQFNLAAGLGIACQMKGKHQVVVCFFGDGASNRGTLHEGMNLSAVWRLPVVFVCENNLYAQQTHVNDVINVKDIAAFAGSYGIPGVVVDGNDVLAVHDAVAVAVGRAREGLGPSLIECKTYRISGHQAIGVESRDPDELEYWRKRDPIVLFRNKLIESGALNQELIELMEKDTTAIVEEAIRYADESPFPDPMDCTKELYAE